MRANKDFGGACGDMGVDLNEAKVSCSNCIPNYAQYMEYILSHNIDKACEALFSYQSVLPGAFSILRWDAIKENPIEAFL
jgi:cellulose synthase/poly-beta-1,6-N-acetylglucosamine synthase-like glycosyltransferase